MAKAPAINTPRFRVSFPHVLKPQTVKNDDGTTRQEYSVLALFPKGADLSGLMKAAENVLIDKFGPDKALWPDGMRSPFRDQAEKTMKDKDERPIIGADGKKVLQAGCEAGAIFMTFRAKPEFKPGLVDANVQDILEERDFYSGCWAIAQVQPFWYSTKGNKGVSFGLRHVQKQADGEPLGGQTKPTDAFKPVEGANDGGDPFEGAASIFGK